MAEGKGAFQGFWEKYIWNPRAEGSTLENPNEKLTASFVDSLYDGSPSYTGIKVNEDNALKFSAVWAANRAICDPISYMGVKVYQKNPDGGREERPDHPNNVLFKRPNQYSSWVTLSNRYVTHRNLWGNGLLRMEVKGVGRDAGDISGLHPIHPSLIKDVHFLSDRKELWWEIYETKNGKKTGATELIPDDEILHLPGLGDHAVGKSIIQYAKEDIGLEFAVQRYGAEVYREGGDPRGILSVNAQLTDPSKMKDVEERIKEQKKRSKTIIIGADSKYQPVAMKPADAEFISTRHFNIQTIARFFGVPSWKLAEHSDGSSTFNNIEHMGIAFLQDTLAPIVATIENEFNNKLFRESEKEQGYYIEFNMDSYLRADAKAKAEMFRTQVQNALKTPNEIRSMNNDNPKPGGDELFIQQNMAPLSLLAEMISAKLK